MGFSGTINLRPAALTMFVEDILESLIAHGFENLLVLNGHGGNTPAIETAKMNIKNRRRDIFLATSSVWLALQDVYETLPETMRQESFRMMVAHGGLFETAAVMAEEPEAVLLDRVTPVPVDAYVQATRPHMQVAITVEDIAGEVGANGDAGPATVEMGEMFIERTVAEIAKAYREALSVFRKTE
jgi:creatinine amidohydrolase